MKANYQEAPVVKAVLDWLNDKYEQQSPPSKSFIAYWDSGLERWMIVCSSYWHYTSAEMKEDSKMLNEEFKDMLSKRLIFTYMYVGFHDKLAKGLPIPATKGIREWVIT